MGICSDLSKVYTIRWRKMISFEIILESWLGYCMVGSADLESTHLINKFPLFLYTDTADNYFSSHEITMAWTVHTDKRYPTDRKNSPEHHLIASVRANLSALLSKPVERWNSWDTKYFSLCLCLFFQKISKVLFFSFFFLLYLFSFKKKKVRVMFIELLLKI